MTVGQALSLLAIIWFLVLFIVLPLRVTSQREQGDIVPGTPESAPHSAALRRKAVIVTGVALVVWGVILAVLLSGAVTIRDLDWFNRMSPPEARSGDRDG